MMAHPLVLHLPGGIRADLIPGTRPPHYAGVEADVTIPDDLARAGWCWHGSYLSDGEVGIFTGTFGVVGAFAQARIHMGLRRTLVVDLGKPKQLSMFSEAA